MNTLLAAFFTGIRAGLRQWRMAAIVYVVQLLLAVTLGMQVYEVLKSSIGNSLKINKLLLHYDHTVISDFLKVHGASLSPLIGQLRWLVPVWLIFSVFLHSGLLYCSLQPQRTGWRDFWRAGAEYFFPFLRLDLLLLFAAGLWSALILLPLLSNLEPALEYFSSEKYAVWLALLVVALWLMGLAFLFLLSVLGRIGRMKLPGTFRAIRAAWRIFWCNKGHFTALLLAFSLLHLLFILAYWLLECATGMTSPGMIVVIFILQQLFSFARSVLRAMVYAGIGVRGNV